MPKDRRITDCAGLVREARARGAEVKKTSNGHYKIVGPAGMAVVSPNWGDPRARQNSIADVRRHAGIDVTEPSDTDTTEQESTVSRTPATHQHTAATAPEPAQVTRADHDELLTMIAELTERVRAAEQTGQNLTTGLGQVNDLVHRLADNVDEVAADLDRRADTLTARVDEAHRNTAAFGNRTTDLAKAEARNRDNITYLNKALTKRIMVLENSVDALADELAEAGQAPAETDWLAEMRTQVTTTLAPFRASAYLPRVTIAELMGINDAFELKRLSYVLMMLRGEGVLESTGTKGSTRWRLTPASAS